MENLLIIFIVITGAAVVLQAGVLLALYLAVRKTTSKVDSVAEEVRTKLLPTISMTQAMLTDLGPKLTVILDDVTSTTKDVHSQVGRIDATVNDVLDRSRLQIIRADELLTRTLDRVEDATEIVHKTVVSPVRQVSGLIQGLTAGIEFLMAGRGRRNGHSRESRRPVPQDEMFI